MVKWTYMTGSGPRDVDAIYEVPNPIEAEFPVKLRLTLYDLKSSDPREKVPSPESRWRAHANLGTYEMFRLFAPTREEAQQRVEEGLRMLFGALLAVVSPLPEDVKLLEAAVKFPAFNDRPRRGRIPFEWMALQEGQQHRAAADRLAEQGLAQVDGELPTRMRVTPAGKRELARLGLIKLDAEGHVVD